MPLSLPEIRHRALGFAREWATETRERAEAGTFWNSFFDVFGISRRRVASLEVPVKKAGGRQGYIDLLWKGLLLVEHKSRGENLDRAAQQARDYFPGLKDAELPRYILVSDFARFRLYDLDEGTDQSFALEELPAHVHLFGFLNGYYKKTYPPEDPANAQAAELLGQLHDGLRAAGYGQHPTEAHYLEVLLVRLLFCCFAEDTGIFEKDQFREFLEERTREDGTDTGPQLQQFFQTLDRPAERRAPHQAAILAALPYVNGALFREMLPLPDFTPALRELLLACTRFNWERISPAVFGSLFQAVADPIRRRTLGAHYTSETNILKVIGPLFLDELKDELRRAGRTVNKLDQLHRRLSTLHLLDPSCGCGNFLVVAYRELRLLELALLRARFGLDLPVPAVGTQTVDLNLYARVRVTQCAGLEIEEFPARVAEVALWLMDHQLNRQLSAEFGQTYLRLPLVDAAHIVHANALTTDWETEFPQMDYIMGNPPFVGSKLMTPAQREGLLAVAGSTVQGAGVLDLVAAWYLKAGQYIKTNPTTRAAFVSTNSITQGEQVSILWGELLIRLKLHIQFAHRTFAWANEARGNAAVYCVIVGFGNEPATAPQLFTYDTPKGEPHALPARSINPYLIEGSEVVIAKRSNPLSAVPVMNFGNMALDGGYLLLSNEEKVDLLMREPSVAPFIRRYMGAREFLYDELRWCLWLESAAPTQLRQLPLVLKRIEEVKKFRLASKAPSTQRFASTPALFRDRKLPTHYLLIPRVTSERRTYIPIGFMTNEVVPSDQTQVIADATPYLFGILTSSMHTSWVKTVCGRLKSDLRYSKDIVYNNYPFPPSPTPAQKKAVEAAAEAVLAARAQFPGQSLAALYDPLTMPPALAQAHAQLDRAVDRCYRPAAFGTELARLEFLFGLYQQLATPLLPAPKTGRAKGKARAAE